MNIKNIIMKKEELKRLLDKYFNGESTEDEERILRIFFNGNNVPEGYEAEKAIFRHYLASMPVPEPSDEFESRIIAAIDESESKGRSVNFKRVLLQSLSAAAGILILMGSYFFFVHKNEPKDTFTDPKLAYAETMKILMNVSARLNQGISALEPVGRINEIASKSFKPVNRSAGIAEKNLKNLDLLQKMFEITNMPVENSINK